MKIVSHIPTVRSNFEAINPNETRENVFCGHVGDVCLAFVPLCSTLQTHVKSLTHFHLNCLWQIYYTQSENQKETEMRCGVDCIIVCIDSELLWFFMVVWRGNLKKNRERLKQGKEFMMEFFNVCFEFSS